jgi:hypothetical protein
MPSRSKCPLSLSGNAGTVDILHDISLTVIRAKRLGLSGRVDLANHLS